MWVWVREQKSALHLKNVVFQIQEQFDGGSKDFWKHEAVKNEIYSSDIYEVQERRGCLFILYNSGCICVAEIVCFFFIIYVCSVVVGV